MGDETYKETYKDNARCPCLSSSSNKHKMIFLSYLYRFLVFLLAILGGGGGGKQFTVIPSQFEQFMVTPTTAAKSGVLRLFQQSGLLAPN